MRSRHFANTSCEYSPYETEPRLNWLPATVRSIISRYAGERFIFLDGGLETRN